VRGNVQTRLKKIQEQGLDGVLLALAGLRRLGLEDRVTQVLEPEESLPAVGQGVLAVQCRLEDRAVCPLVARLEDARTRTAITAERAFLAELEGGCTVPLAGYAVVSDGGEVFMRGLVGQADGKRVLRNEARGPAQEADALGRAVAGDILRSGGRELLRDFAHRPGAIES
jgi:hydroxymethylbilane synthase